MSLCYSVIGVIVAAFVAGLTYICYACKQKHKYWAKKGVKYEEPTMFVGNIKLFGGKAMVEAAMETYNRFPDDRYVGSYLFLEPTLLIKDPDLIKQITIKNFDHFTDHRTIIPPGIDPLWDNNLFATTGQKWQQLRRTLSPAFTANKLKIVFELIEECAKSFAEFLEESEEKGNNVNKSGVLEFEIKDLISRFTNDVIATSAFGVKCDSLRERGNEFYKMGKQITDFTGIKGLKMFVSAFSPAIAKIFGIRIIPKRLANYFSTMIADAVKTREEQNIIRPDMIHLLIQAKRETDQQNQATKENENDSNDEIGTSPKPKKEVTIDDIVSQAFIFFLAGFETVSTTLTFILYELALNPEIQDKLRNEFKSINKLTYEKLLSLKYLDMVVSEGLRKWPGPITTDRAVNKQFTIEPVNPDEKALELEPGVSVSFFLFGLHRDPKYFPDPEQFDPERFNEENKHKIPPCAYMPFGTGPRACIGNRFALLEIKLLFYYVLKGFEVVPVERSKIPLELDPKQLGSACKGGMWLGFKKI